jgi:cytochrome c oxidase subunit II
MKRTVLAFLLHRHHRLLHRCCRFSALMLTLVLTGCDGIQSMLDPKGPAAQNIANIWWLMFCGFTLVFLWVMALALYAVYRSPEKRRKISAKSLVIWGGIVLPLVAVVPLLFYGLQAGYRWLDAPEGAFRIDVIGHQFWWEVRYPDIDGNRTVITANEVHIPAGRPVQIRLQSNDVIHSFWVPNLAGKMDVFPERVNTVQLYADEPGVFRGQCAEFCGAQHARMTFYAVAHTEADFMAWLASQRLPAVEPQTEAQQRGQQAFMDNLCDQCHRIRGTEADGEHGPDLTHLGSRKTLAAGALAEVNAATIAHWISRNQHVKPGVRMPDFSDIDHSLVMDIAIYLESLK